MENLSFLADKYFNQNLVTFIISVVGVIFAKIYEIDCLMYLCFALLIFALFSLVITLCFYVANYVSRKYYKAKCYKMRYEYTKEQKEKGTLKDSCGESIIKW